MNQATILARIRTTHATTLEARDTRVSRKLLVCVQQRVVHGVHRAPTFGPAELRAQSMRCEQRRCRELLIAAGAIGAPRDRLGDLGEVYFDILSYKYLSKVLKSTT